MLKIWVTRCLFNIGFEKIASIENIGKRVNTGVLGKLDLLKKEWEMGIEDKNLKKQFCGIFL